MSLRKKLWQKAILNFSWWDIIFLAISASLLLFASVFVRDMNLLLLLAFCIAFLTIFQLTLYYKIQQRIQAIQHSFDVLSRERSVHDHVLAIEAKAQNIDSQINAFVLQQSTHNDKVIEYVHNVPHILTLNRTLYIKDTLREQKRILLEAIPSLFMPCTKELLYVSARMDRFDFGEEFRKASYTITVLEIFQPNVDYLRSIPWVKNVVCGDARTYQPDKPFDITFWWHGPEHFEQDEIPLILSLMESYTKEMVIIGCPWGMGEQNALRGNPHDIHLSMNDPQFFESLGYTTFTSGVRDVPASTIVAVKCLSTTGLRKHPSG